VARLSEYGADRDVTRPAITELGLKYELLTAYTSFVAVHEKVRNPEGSAEGVDQPLPLPQGVSDLAVPEPELPLLLLLTVLLCGLATAGRTWRRSASR
jgi:Ca-activated chloride channel family protein